MGKACGASTGRTTENPAAQDDSHFGREHKRFARSAKLNANDSSAKVKVKHRENWTSLDHGKKMTRERLTSALSHGSADGMGAPRAWTTISGKTPGGADLAVQGEEALRTAHFDPDFCRIEIDTSVNPPRVLITSPAVDELERDLNTLTNSVTALAARVTALEAGGRWTVPNIVVGTTGPESANLVLGSFHRFDLSSYGSFDTMTATLPLVTAGSVGRRVAVTEVTGSLIGPGQIQLNIETTGGQAIDSRTLPIELAGIRPRIVFVAVLVSVGVYGWSVESYDAD